MITQDRREDAARRGGRFLARLGRARQGGVAMMFALAMPPVALMAVAGVDFHRASTVRMNLQDALDAATLAAARSSETTTAGVNRVGLAALRANLANYPGVRLAEGNTAFVLNADGSVDSRAKVTVDTLVADMFLGGSMDVGAEASVLRSNNRLEIALVIDNTGSMASGGRMRAAQDAATNLVDRLAAAAERSPEDDAVRISLVPFSMTVRVGAEYRTAAWMDTSANAYGNDQLFSGGVNRIALFNALGVSWAGCVESRPYPYDTRDTAPHASDRNTLFVHYFAPDEPDVDLYSSDWTWRNYRVDNDYVSDGLSATSSNKNWTLRARRTDKYGNSPNFSGGRGPNRGCDLEPLTRLTTDYRAITRSIARMTPSGNTNIPMGLVWGWHTLSPNAPFGDGRPYGEERLTKIAILMTDGDNVNSTYSNPHNSTYSGVGYIGQGRLGVGTSSSANQRRDAMDDRMAELCRNMQSAGIVIYTVGVGVDSRTQTLLRNCATSRDNFFNVSSAGGIGEAFDRIAGSIENLRISR